MSAGRAMQSFHAIERLKVIYGFVLLLILGGLAAFFGVGHVEEKTSFGLMPVITTLSTLAGLFGGWAFREKPPEELKREEIVAWLNSPEGLQFLSDFKPSPTEGPQ